MTGFLHFWTTCFRLGPYFMFPYLISTEPHNVEFPELLSTYISFCTALTLPHRAQYNCLDVHDTWCWSDSPSQSASYSYSSSRIALHLSYYIVFWYPLVPSPDLFICPLLLPSSTADHACILAMVLMAVIVWWSSVYNFISY